MAGCCYEYYLGNEKCKHEPMPARLLSKLYNLNALRF